jgi:outer membrane protein insertion porin family
VTYPLSDKSKIQIEYSISQTELSNPGAVGALITAEVNEGKVTSSSIGYQYSHDTRLYSTGAKSGLLLNFGQNFSGLGGDKTSLKTTLKAAAETNTLNEELKLTAVLEAGILSYTSGNSRVLDRFFLGSNKMRGFEPDGIGPRECPNKQCNNSNDDALGGERFGVVRFEAEFPLGLPEEYGFSGGLYYDVGNVWSLNRVNNNVLYEEGVWRQVVGATIFWKTPIGPLRFNFSETLKKAVYDKDESFDLTISTRF